MDVFPIKAKGVRLVLAVTNCMFVTGLIYGQSLSAVPQVSCKVVNCLNQAQPVPKSCEVSNGDYIYLEIVLKTTNNSAVLQVPQNMVNPAPIPTQGVYYLVTVFRESDGANMPLQISVRGAGGGSGVYKTEVALVIPYSQSDRLEKIKSWWNNVKARAKGADRTAINQARLKDDQIYNAMEQELIENQSGRFKIICSYTSSQPGTWNGEVDSAPVEIEIMKTGTILDKKPQ